MEKNILEEINRMHEIMGSSVVFEQNLEKGQIINYKGEKKKIIDIIPKTLQDIIVPQEFEAGATELTPATTTKLDATIQELIDFLATPELRNISWKKLGLVNTDPFIGRNEELGKLRAKAVSDYFKKKLNNVGITNIEFPEANVKIGSTDWESNKEAYKNKDSAIIAKFNKEQFMNLSLGAAAVEVVLADLPKICGQKMEKSGTRANKNDKGVDFGWASYPQNDGKGFEIDLGENTEGVITFTFDSYTIPDMFQITYNEETFTSSGPGGMEGFVSGTFSNCDEGSSCARFFTNEIKKLNKDLGKKERKTKKAGEKVDKAYAKSKNISIKYRNILKRENKLETPKSIDLAWFKKFFKLFPPQERSSVGKMFRNKRSLKYNPKFKGGYSRYKEITDSDDNIVGYEGSGTFIDGKDVWDHLIDIWGDLDKGWDGKKGDLESSQGDTKNATSSTEKQIIDLENDLIELQKTGKSSKYSEKMSKILTSDPYNYPNGVIGEQGKIVIDKVKNVQYAYVQVYAPLGGTEWECQISCKKKTETQV